MNRNASSSTFRRITWLHYISTFISCLSGVEIISCFWISVFILMSCSLLSWLNYLDWNIWYLSSWSKKEINSCALTEEKIFSRSEENKQQERQKRLKGFPRRSKGNGALMSIETLVTSAVEYKKEGGGCVFCVYTHVKLWICSEPGNSLWIRKIQL